MQVPSVLNNMAWKAMHCSLPKARPTVSTQTKKSYYTGVPYYRKRWSWIFSDNQGSCPSIYTSQQNTLEKEKTQVLTKV